MGKPDLMTTLKIQIEREMFYGLRANCVLNEPDVNWKLKIKIIKIPFRREGRKNLPPGRRYRPIHKWGGGEVCI